MKIAGILKKFFKRKPLFPLILVTGAPKTGTTAVYHSIREALPDDAICQFEPENRNLQMPETITTPVLVKSFIPNSIAYDNFVYKILITRDPRDHIISQMLYRPYNIITADLIKATKNSEQFLEETLELLERKEKEPLKINLRDIYELHGQWLMNHYGQRIIHYFDTHPNAFILKYEDYIDGKLAGLEKYLGFSLKKAENVPQKRVIRSKTYGNWKDWFTPADVDYYRPLFKTYMERFGYQDDWMLNEKPRIDPAISSQYVRRIIQEARESVMNGKKGPVG